MKKPLQSAEEGLISAGREQSYSVFGPRSSPLYYTTLSRLPNRLVFAGLTKDSLCSIVLTNAKSEARMQWTFEARPVNGVCVWPLTALPTHTELHYAWRVEEADWPHQAPTTDPLQAQLPPREGYFRVLAPDGCERLLRGQQRLGQMQDASGAASAGALFLAEFGLYHEALASIENYLKRQKRRNDLLLARTVQALIYKQMLHQIEQEQHRQTVGVGLLDWYSRWTYNRERYHRELTLDLMQGRCPRRCYKEIASLS